MVSLETIAFAFALSGEAAIFPEPGSKANAPPVILVTAASVPPGDGAVVAANSLPSVAVGVVTSLATVASLRVTVTF